jgi:hypothetical protein
MYYCNNTYFKTFIIIFSWLAAFLFNHQSTDRIEQITSHTQLLGNLLHNDQIPIDTLAEAIIATYVADPIERAVLHTQWHYVRDNSNAEVQFSNTNVTQVSEAPSITEYSNLYAENQASCSTYPTSNLPVSIGSNTSVNLSQTHEQINDNEHPTSNHKDKQPLSTETPTHQSLHDSDNDSEANEEPPTDNHNVEQHLSTDEDENQELENPYWDIEEDEENENNLVIDEEVDIDDLFTSSDEAYSSDPDNHSPIFHSDTDYYNEHLHSSGYETDISLHLSPPPFLHHFGWGDLSSSDSDEADPLQYNGIEEEEDVSNAETIRTETSGEDENVEEENASDAETIEYKRSNSEELPSEESEAETIPYERSENVEKMSEESSEAITIGYIYSVKAEEMPELAAEHSNAILTEMSDSDNQVARTLTTIADVTANNFFSTARQLQNSVEQCVLKIEPDQNQEEIGQNLYQACLNGLTEGLKEDSVNAMLCTACGSGNCKNCQDRQLLVAQNCFWTVRNYMPDCNRQLIWQCLTNAFNQLFGYQLPEYAWQVENRGIETLTEGYHGAAESLTNANKPENITTEQIADETANEFELTLVERKHDINDTNCALTLLELAAQNETSNVTQNVTENGVNATVKTNTKSVATQTGGLAIEECRANAENMTTMAPGNHFNDNEDCALTRFLRNKCQNYVGNNAERFTLAQEMLKLFKKKFRLYILKNELVSKAF